MAEDQVTVKLNSQEVCPLMARFISVLDASDVMEDDSHRRMTIATALAACASVIAGAEGAELADIVEVAEKFAKIFVDGMTVDTSASADD